MPYLPPALIEETAFPEAFDKDIKTQIRLISELYCRSFPRVDYYQIRKAVTPATNENTIVGEDTNSKFDPLWGETVDPNMTTWKQPHLSGDMKSADVDVYDIPTPLHFRIQREVLEKDLKKYGFDQVRALLAFVPLSLLDAGGVTLNAGDRFKWDDTMYSVKQFELIGFWKNTNVRLYAVLNCDNYRPGS